MHPLYPQSLKMAHFDDKLISFTMIYGFKQIAHDKNLKIIKIYLKTHKKKKCLVIILGVYFIVINYSKNKIRSIYVNEDERILLLFVHRNINFLLALPLNLFIFLCLFFIRLVTKYLFTIEL